MVPTDEIVDGLVDLQATCGRDRVQIRRGTSEVNQVAPGMSAKLVAAGQRAVAWHNRGDDRT